jgi:hypothetical protein
MCEQSMGTCPRKKRCVTVDTVWHREEVCVHVCPEMLRVLKKHFYMFVLQHCAWWSSAMVLPGCMQCPNMTLL